MRSPLLRVVIGVIVACVVGYMKYQRTASRSHPRSSSPTAIETEGNDPRLRAARDQAIRRWPEFVAAFNEHKAGRSCVVKYPFPVKGGGKEHIWVDVEAIDGTSIRGRIANEPDYEIGHTYGDEVTIGAGGISDWMYSDGDDHHGGFTIPVLEQIEAENGRR